MGYEDFVYYPYEGLPVETRIEILRNAIRFLEAKYPDGEVAKELRDKQVEQLKRLEALRS